MIHSSHHQTFLSDKLLAENNLLIHPDGVAVSLADCEDLAQMEGAENGWILAARYASRMLPQIFHTDDVLLEIEFPINDRLPLEKLLASLPQETFTADDSLGWVYQFWQSKKKDEVNSSGAKIDGRTLSAVTQLFTEPYMVKFLLHNTIGAWWCAQHGITGPPGGAGVPAGQAPVEMEYLRWRDDGTPAAGTFDGWPKTLKEFTVLDPCCGSGHFLVETFHLLVPLRMNDERLSNREACDAVLAENLFGLELDPRCTQIAAFALALAAWKYPNESGQPWGYRPLPTLQIACSGQSVTGKKEEWLALANGDSRLLEGIGKLYDLFRQAPHLGSLIDPRSEAGDLIAAGFAELQPLLDKALAKEKVQKDAEAAAVGVAAQGIARAADFLARQYTLVATNVPYLAHSKHAPVLYAFCEAHYPKSRSDLATVCMERITRFIRKGGAVALVTPQNWLFLKRYKSIRTKLLKETTWRIVARLGPAAFETISGEVVKAVLVVLSYGPPSQSSEFMSMDVSGQQRASNKASALHLDYFTPLSQEQQINNPDSIVTTSGVIEEGLVGRYAMVRGGITTGDSPYFRRCFWENHTIKDGWVKEQLSCESETQYSGREYVLLWEDGDGEIAKRTGGLGATIAGREVWGQRGISINYTGQLRATLYTGEIFENVICVLVPRDPSYLSALWCFCSSDEFVPSIRSVNQKLSVDVRYFEKAPIDIDRWQSVAQRAYPNGLPEPHSDNPTQWLFKGDIVTSTDPLQVAITRMLGYRWPEQPREEDTIDALADKDGIVCIPAVRGERPVAERLLDILRTAYDSQWADTTLHKLITDGGGDPGTPLDDWLRDRFFEQHCKRFHHRPFIWHIWDGRKDGFSCLVNYHKLTHQRLETLTYAYLQDWITAQAAAARDSKPGADLRLAAAQELQNKLKLILDGEPPYDIFVRWKPIREQPIGWNPDLNDGVRVNIRPFVVANVLRKPPNIKWSKDRGKEPECDPEQFPWFWKTGVFTGDRINDVHLTNARKRAARVKTGQG